MGLWADLILSAPRVIRLQPDKFADMAAADTYYEELMRRLDPDKPSPIQT